MSGRIIMMIGNAQPSRSWADEQPPEVELWCANEAGSELGAARSRIFQMHPRDWREAEREFFYGRFPENLGRDCFGRRPGHVDDLRSCGVPVFGQQVWPDIPTSQQFPFEQVRDSVGVPTPPHGKKILYATSTFGYMMALALTEHRLGMTIEEIRFAGIELPNGTQRERVWEAPNLNYYMGLAVGMGIRLGLCPTGTTLLNAPPYALGFPHIYSLDFWPAPMLWMQPVLNEEAGIYEVQALEPAEG